MYKEKNSSGNTEEILKKINILRKEKNAVILAHSYQPLDIQHVADYIGDSLGLCIQAGQTEAEVIVFCGVHFMAESAKILNQKKTVLLPVKEAGCPMADMASGGALRELKAEHPGAMVVCYVNSTAEVKAESDICCTSSNAVEIIRSIPRDREIIFVPDRHLGEFAAAQAERDVVLWDGYCPVHQRITGDDIQRVKEKHPDAIVMVHPECSREVREMADYVGSTTNIYNKAASSAEQTFIIGTEEGIVRRMREELPNKLFLLPDTPVICADMKKISLEDVAESLSKNEPEIRLEPQIAARALDPVKRMLEKRG